MEVPRCGWRELPSNTILTQDVIERLRPMIIELERKRKDVLLVTHRVVIRTLLSYFLGLSLADLVHLDIPLHMVYRLRPMPYGTALDKCNNIEFNIKMSIWKRQNRFD